MKRARTIAVLITGLTMGTATAPAWSASTPSQCTAEMPAGTMTPHASAPNATERLALSTMGDLRRSSSAGLEQAQLIGKLKLARENDDRNEQTMLNEFDGADSGMPSPTAEFDEQKALVDEVVGALEKGEPVSESRIAQALMVPVAP